MDKEKTITDIFEKINAAGVMNVWRSHIEDIVELFPNHAEEAFNEYLKIRRIKPIAAPKRYIIAIAAGMADKDSIKDHATQERDDFINGAGV